MLSLLKMNKENAKNIIDLIKSGDREVLQKIYNENRDTFIKFSKKYNVEEYDALDIYQDAVLIFYENIISGKIVSGQPIVSISVHDLQDSGQCSFYR